MMSNVLRLEGIAKKYGEKTALQPLSLDIAGGEFLSLFGANGAGKSTLLKIVSMQIKPSAGKILYSGESVVNLADKYRAKLGVISHNAFLYDGLSAIDNLSFYGRLYGVANPEKQAETLLKRVDMSKRMHDPVRTYSRGMLQRTSIARALLNDPAIIFLDEPYTGLDRHASYVLTDILKEQIAKDTTIVLVTHDLPLGYELADKILILSKGRTVYYGAKDIPESDFEKFYLKVVED